MAFGNCSVTSRKKDPRRPTTEPSPGARQSYQSRKMFAKFAGMPDPHLKSGPSSLHILGGEDIEHWASCKLLAVLSFIVFGFVLLYPLAFSMVINYALLWLNILFCLNYLFNHLLIIKLPTNSNRWCYRQQVLRRQLKKKKNNNNKERTGSQAEKQREKNVAYPRQQNPCATWSKKLWPG